MVHLELEDLEKEEKYAFLRGALRRCVSRAESFYLNEISPQLGSQSQSSSDPEARYWSLFSSYMKAVYEYVSHGDIDLFCVTVDSGEIARLLDEFFKLIALGGRRGTENSSDQGQPSSGNSFGQAPLFPVLELSTASIAGDSAFPQNDYRLNLNVIDEFLMNLDRRGMSAPRLEFHLLSLALLHEYASWWGRDSAGSTALTPLSPRISTVNAKAGYGELERSILAKSDWTFWSSYAILVAGAGASLLYGYAWIALICVMTALPLALAHRREDPGREAQALIARAFTRAVRELRPEALHQASLERAMIDAEKSGVVWPACAKTFLERLAPYSSQVNELRGARAEENRDTVVELLADSLLGRR